MCKNTFFKECTSQNVFFVVQNTGQKKLMQSGLYNPERIMVSGLYNPDKYDIGETNGNMGLCVW